MDFASQMDQALENEDCRMVLICGQPCCGKTALCAHWKKQHVLRSFDSEYVAIGR